MRFIAIAFVTVYACIAWAFNFGRRYGRAEERNIMKELITKACQEEGIPYDVDSDAGTG